MQWLKNRTVTTKLMAGFGISTLFLIAVGVFGLKSIGEVNDHLEDLYQNQTLGISYIKEANINLLAISRAMRNAILDEDDASIKKRITDIESYDAALRKHLEQFKPLLLTQEDKDLFEEAGKDYAELKRLVDQVTTLALAHKDKDARAMLKTTRAKGDAVDAVMDKLAKHKETQAREAEREAEAVYAEAKKMVLLFIVVGGLCGLGLGWAIARTIAAGLRQVNETTQKAAAGDFSGRVALATTDEVGQMAAAFNKMMDAVSPVIREVRQGASSVSAASGQISSGNQDLAQRTAEQASALEETSSAMEQMTSTTKQNADNAKQANQLGIAAREVAEKGGGVVSQAVASMQEINSSSKKIADIIGVIDEIAFQTNLLALNAAVEAARAGEQGRGFAVVAAEVRNLAQRSATAAKEIKGLINESVQKVGEGSVLVNRCGETLGEIVGSVKRVTDIIAEIAAASQEQSAGIDQVNKAIMEMDKTTQQNAALVEESAAASQGMQQQAGALLKMVEFFKVGEGPQDETTPHEQVKPVTPAPAKGVIRAPQKTVGRHSFDREPVVVGNGHGTMKESFEEF